MKAIYKALVGTALVATGILLGVQLSSVERQQERRAAGNSAPDSSVVLQRLEKIESQLADLGGRIERQGPGGEFSGRLSSDTAAKAPPLDEPAGRAPSPAAVAGSRLLEKGGRAQLPMDDSAKALQVRRVTERLEDKLATEEVDPGWANNVSAALGDVLTTPALSGSQLDAVDCKSTLCRIEVSTPDSAGDTAFGENYLRFSPFADGPSVFHRRVNPDGSSAWTIYVAREGFDLPLRGSQGP